MLADAWPKVNRVGRIWPKINLSWPMFRSEMIGVGRRLTEVGLTLPVVRYGRIWKVLTLSPAPPSARELIRPYGAQRDEETTAYDLTIAENKDGKIIRRVIKVRAA